MWNGHPPTWALLRQKTFIFRQNLANSLNEKEKVGSARKVTWLALPGYPFLIAGSISKQVFLGWNYHCVLLSYVSVMLVLVKYMSEFSYISIGNSAKSLDEKH